MRIGVHLPTSEIGTDPSVLRDYAQASEEMGYNHMNVPDHVIPPDPTDRPRWSGYFNSTDVIHEPFILFAYMGGITKRIKFVTSVLVLPQRQAQLVAKQAAELDMLTGGRLRLGVGVGYNSLEYESMGFDFATRGERMEEQVILMQRLWTEPVVEFHGKWHNIDRAGINPMPIQRPIPIFMGGSHPRVLARAARLADGWIPSISIRPTVDGIFTPEDMSSFPERLANLKEAVSAAGRDPDKFQVRGQVRHDNKTPDEWVEDVETMKRLGFTHIHVDTTSLGLQGAQHIEPLRHYMDAVRHLVEPVAAT